MRKLRSLYSFFLSYIIILIIPLIIGIVVYPEIIDIVETEEKKFNLHLLEKAQDTLDNTLMEIDRMMLSLGNDSFVRRFASSISLRYSFIVISKTISHTPA